MEGNMTPTSTQSNTLLGASITIPETVVYRDFPSETVVLNLETGQYHGLNPMAGEMLTALQESDSVDAAARQIAERHGVELARVQPDICSLCETLAARGLISVESAAAA
jgi:Coenzyme PQQ synthesis protein D (PqqD)